VDLLFGSEFVVDNSVNKVMSFFPLHS
jgi:hypothetical protein